MRLSSLTFARHTYDTAWNLNYRTNNGSLSTFIVDNKNQLTNVVSSPNTYDQNGNLTSTTNGHNIYVYDDENRLIQLFHYQVSSASRSTGDHRTDFLYDGLGRLRKRLEYSLTCPGGGGQQGLAQPGGAQPNSGGGGDGCLWSLPTETRYIYDRMRVIQERDGNNTPTVSYTRGNDLSVSLQGAGGIGGLLARSSGYSSGNWTSHADYYADGNGNVTSLIDANQSVIASYRYDPFGNIISKSGTLADANVYRFSSKEVHVNSGMYYYGFRFYDPNLQRWINSDVLGDISGLPTTTANLSPTVESDSRGGMSTDELFGAWTDINRNLFAAMKNAPINYWDPLGLKTCNGDARVLQGNKNTVGKPGGFSGDAQHPVNVTAESAAVDPAQWGGKDRLRPNRDKISGIFTDSSGKQVGKFSGITDVIGGKPPKGAKGNVRDELKKLNPGKLIVELPGADKDLGTVHVTLTVPDDMNCPEGTK